MTQIHPESNFEGRSTTDGSNNMQYRHGQVGCQSEKFHRSRNHSIYTHDTNEHKKPNSLQKL